MSRFIILLLLVTISGSIYGKTAKSTLILLSIDGFAYDYLAKYQPKHMVAFGKTGVKAKLLPVYPSKTFPNHLSIITGVYPAKHGIIHNKFYQPHISEQYSLGAGKKNSAWLTAKPFWSFAEENNVTTAVYFWPESEVIGQGSQPSYNIPYNKTDSEKKQFDQIINWLKLPKEHAPQFVVSYFTSIDDAGHRYGLDSKELSQAIAEIDELFGSFISHLQQEIALNVNVILVSDHGMMQINKKKHIDLSEVFNEKVTELIIKKSIILAESNTQLYLYFNQGKLSNIQKKSIIQELENNQKINTDLYQLYQKGNYPRHWQLDGNLAVIPDLIIEASASSNFISNKYSSINVATHGYDSLNQKELTAIFLASGPSIAKGREVNAFENIHIVPLMSQLLGLKQMASIDGESTVLAPIIKSN